MLVRQFYQSPAAYCGSSLAPINVELPEIDDATPQEDVEINCDDGVWTGSEPITYQYQWYQAEGVAPPSLPVSTVAPVVSGSITQGATLHVTDGTWDGDPVIYSYQWKRLPSTLVGINSDSYTTVIADLGFNITCTVTAANAMGAVPQAASNSRGPITEPAPGASLTDDEGEVLLTDEDEELTTDA